MTGTQIAVPDTGEIVTMTPAEAKARAEWVRDITRAALTEGVDYGTIPGTPKPTLYKSGAEMLILAAGLSPSIVRLDDNDSREHRGVTYRCTIVRPNGTIAAVCDGYAGNDERRAPWNTHVKMAQKRALVGAALNACAASGLFTADLDDEAPPQKPANRDRPIPPIDRTVLAEWYANLAPPLQHRVTKATQREGLGEPNTVAERDRVAWLILSNIPERRRPEASTAWAPPTAEERAADMEAEIEHARHVARQADDDTDPDAGAPTRYDPADTDGIPS